ncbi:uncharacterized protein LAESUDRAFT_728038 [Laetiporus sulphureus 93-53]|uniref:Endoplasmic reticulum junction formation protein lunapark n=1 Tax=Laetiporus sulphureus 93-53 TaxID=1314785 RepID=A0A165DCA4_9APHY|nr:uncharacterized protein LAESUDRAFT_728038 [Laetiporus sulphureus 93-53]KZT04546.1 hypothetical protein LAESUDRAFT_728038 [Laetiporus sulphureus 93-53]
MVSFFGWFKKSKPEDYEQVLASLALDIQKRQTRLSEIRLRERRSTLYFSLVAVALWASWSGLWYAGLLPNVSGHNRNSSFERTAKGVPVFLGPILILFTRRIVQIWYTRIGDKEEKALVTLRKQQRDKIEEIKNKTNYYSTRNLLERYDDGSSIGGASSPIRPRMPQQRIPPSPQREPQVRKPNPPVSSQLQQHLSPLPQYPLPPLRKQWFDKLADAILGDDDGSVSTAASRYALICQKCFAHNGLVKESQWEDTQYVCPKCGYFNSSPRSIRQARSLSKSPDARVHVALPGQPDQPQPVAPVAAQPAGAKDGLASSTALDSGNSSRKRNLPNIDTATPDEGESIRMDVDS